MLLAHKIELRPTPDQVDYFEKALGHRRHCFNHLLAWFSQKDSDGNPIFKWSKTEAYQFFMKVLRVEFSWYSEVSSVITRNVIEDLDNAYKHFFRRLKNGEKAGYPKPKKKGVNERFAIRDVAKFDIKDKTLRIEKLKTRIEMRQPIRFGGKTKQVTISKRAGKYFASILVDTDEYDPNDVDRQESVGVDFGIKSLAILSNGEVFENEKLLRNNLRKLKKLQRNLARKVKGSNGYAKAKLKIQKLHFLIARQRAAIAHQLSNYLTKTFDRIVIEDLNIKGMLKNRKLSRAIADVGWGMLRQFIEYKAKLRNCVVVIADKFFPSSQLKLKFIPSPCSNCGEVKKNLTLANRVYECDSCGFTLDRDLNAAINLNNYAV